MSVYRYYLPRVKPADVSDDTLIGLGLSARLRDCTIRKHKGNRIEVVEIVEKGPDGSSGSLIIPQPSHRRGVASYRPDRCESYKSLHGDYFIVWDKADPPTPEGLQRWETIPGVWCELGDGQIWQCPTIRTAATWPSVPRSYSRLNGQLTWKILPDYQEVWRRSAHWSLRLLDGMRQQSCIQLFGHDVAFDAAGMSLAVNYRVSDEECSLLGLWNDFTVDRAIDAAVDMDWFQDIDSDQKKTAAWSAISDDLRSSLLGSVASIPDTSQAGPTSNSSGAASESGSQS